MASKYFSNYLKCIVILGIIFFIVSTSAAQNSKQQERLFFSALDYIESRNFEKALGILHNLDTVPLNKFLTGKNNFDSGKYHNDTVSLEKVYVKYLISVCYLELKNENEKAASYMEFVLKTGFAKSIKSLYADLGYLYIKLYKFDEAMYYFNRYLELSNVDDDMHNQVKRGVEICNFANQLVKDTLDIEVSKLNERINTKYSEINPIISENDSLLYFERIKLPESTKIEKNKLYERELMVSYKEFGVWSEPQNIRIPLPDKKLQPELAGISVDGETVYFSMLSGGNYDLYSCRIVKARCKVLIPLGNQINTRFNEKHVSFQDSKNMFYTSNKPDGEGGFDIYKAELLPNGEWGNSKNLGNTVNTRFNEITPRFQAVTKLLYFASEGHNTMGGYDIFSVSGLNSANATIRNVGFPINTPLDNSEFAISENSLLYFPVSQFNEYNRFDLFSVDLSKNIPLTFLNGTLIATNSTKKLNAKIKIIDKSTNKPITFSRNPDPVSGKYFAFFEPEKYYDIIIETAEYLPQLITIFVPRQTYFYELFQEIRINPLALMGEPVGEEITVVNTFYDIYKDQNSSDNTMQQLGLRNELISIIDSINTVGRRPVQLKNLGVSENPEAAEDTINGSKYSKLFDLIGDAIEKGDSTVLKLLDEKTEYNQKYTQKHYYNKSKEETYLYPVKTGNVTIYTAPPINAFVEETDNKINTKNTLIRATDNKELDHSKVNNNRIIDPNISKERTLVKQISIFYKTNSSVIQPEAEEPLEVIAKFLVLNPKTEIEIHSYSNSLGDEKMNKLLSQDRSASVERFMLKNGVLPKRIKIFGHGEAKKGSESEDEMEKNKRSDVFIYFVL